VTPRVGRGIFGPLSFQEKMNEEPQQKTICGINILWLLPPQIAIIIFLASLGLDYLWPTPPEWRFKIPLLGFLLIFFGFAAILWTRVLFYKRKTPILPTAIAKTLVVEGPFRVTRNPIYLGGVALFAGYALISGTFFALFTPVAFFLLMNFTFIPFEERRLLNTFGEPYAAYARRVKRWL
jgi:protein-S-isoprenylcysteine O-methyltransferase Ste14